MQKVRVVRAKLWKEPKGGSNRKKLQLTEGHTEICESLAITCELSVRK